MADVRENIAVNIRRYRKKRELKQQMLAEKVNVKNSAVSNWENGRNAPDIDTLIRICDTLNVSIAQICGMTEKEPGGPNAKEMDMINKYRYLDGKGKHTVETLIEIEYARVSGDRLEMQKKLIGD